MRHQEARTIALQWFETLALPAEVKGQQINTNAFLDHRDHPVLLSEKRRLLARALKRRGARIINEPDNWNREERPVAVSEYMAALRARLSGQIVSGASVRDNLISQLSKTSKAVRFKLRHISSILVNSEQPYLADIKPLPRASIDSIDWYESEELKRLLREQVDSDDFVALATAVACTPVITSPVPATPDVTPDAPPEFDCFDDSTAQKHTLRIPTRVNYVEREQANRSLGEAGEQWIMACETSRLASLGRDDLARKVVWASKDVGDGLGYDIHSFNTDGSDRLIEVKTTRQGKYTPFFITRNELNFAREHPKDCFIYRVFDFTSEPKHFVIDGDVESQLDLTPVNYRARIKPETHVHNGVSAAHDP